MTTKFCKKCNIEKDLSEFAKYRYNGELRHKATCRECYKPTRQKYYESHAPEIVIHNSEYKKKNRKFVNERERNRRKNDIGYKLYNTVRSIVKISIKRNNGHKDGAPTLKYLAYSINELQQHLESLFEPWMRWDNWGKYDARTWNDSDPATWTWQIDHVIPQSDSPYINMNDDNFKKCWALQNLRPLSARQNVIEGSARTRHQKVA
jgi:hypothetical protein